MSKKYEGILKQARDENPANRNIPDAPLLRLIHQAYYSDLPEQDFYKMIDYDGPDAPFDMSLSETVKNIPGSAAQMGKDLYAAVSNPMETMGNFQSLGQGAIEKFIPNEINGVDFGQTENENMADAVGNMYADRYGGINRIKRTIQNDPVGSLGDLAMVGGGVGTLPKLGKLGAFSKAIDPVNVAYNTTKKLAGKMIPGELPAKLMSSAMTWDTVSKNGLRANDKSKIMLKNNLSPTIASVDKGWDMVYSMSNGIDEILSRFDGEKIPRREVFSLIQREKDKAARGSTGKKQHRDIDRVVKDLDEFWYNHEMDYFTPSELQYFKKDLYKELQKAYKDSKAPTTGTENAQLSIAEVARNKLESFDPSIKPTNAAEGELISILPEMEKKVNRITNRNVLPITAAPSAGAGYLIGNAMGSPELGTILGVGASYADMPRPKAAIAQGLHNMQNASMTGNSLSALAIRQQMIAQERIEKEKELKKLLGIPFGSLPQK